MASRGAKHAGFEEYQGGLCAVLCCAVLCCAVLCCAVLRLGQCSNPPISRGQTSAVTSDKPLRPTHLQLAVKLPGDQPLDQVVARGRREGEERALAEPVGGSRLRAGAQHGGASGVEGGGGGRAVEAVIACDCRGVLHAARASRPQPDAPPAGGPELEDCGAIAPVEGGGVLGVDAGVSVVGELLRDQAGLGGCRAGRGAGGAVGRVWRGWLWELARASPGYSERRGSICWLGALRSRRPAPRTAPANALDHSVATRWFSLRPIRTESRYRISTATSAASAG